MNSFEKVVKLAKSKQIVVFLDYDGTLSPIVANPDRALMSDEVSFTLIYYVWVMDANYSLKSRSFMRICYRRNVGLLLYFKYRIFRLLRELYLLCLLGCLSRANPVFAVVQMRATVKELATCFPTAIISGRARPKVRHRVLFSPNFFGHG